MLICGRVPRCTTTSVHHGKNCILLPKTFQGCRYGVYLAGGKREAFCSERGTCMVVKGTSEVTTESGMVEDLMEFLKEDLQHLFDDQGIDETKYEDKVEFEDPITRHTSLKGYLANIKFLRLVFDPSFTLLDIRQTGDWEITTRWSMAMRPTFVPKPFLSLWEPKLSFTGTSVMKINPKTGKFVSHIDTWDALTSEQQNFFSIPAFANVMNQIFDLKRAPRNLETPPYTLLWKKLDYEVRKYESMSVAEVKMGKNGSSSFNSLAGYIFGGNEEKQKLEMTTPVLSSVSDSARDGNTFMQFYLGNNISPENAPNPLETSSVTVKNVPAGIYAVKTFDGYGDEISSKRVAAELRSLLKREGLQLKNKEPILARYNDPTTPPPFRRNEILFELDHFRLW